MNNMNEKLMSPEGLNLGGAAAAGAVAPAPAPEKPKRIAKPADKHGWWWGTGRRNAAVARVRIKPAADGTGKITFYCDAATCTFPEKTVEQYFSEERDRADVQLPLKMTGVLGRMDVKVRCSGGGYMGQAGAVKLGIARALADYDPSFDDMLRKAGFMTRDSRKVERKKYGQAGARRRFQFSKR